MGADLPPMDEAPSRAALRTRLISFFASLGNAGVIAQDGSLMERARQEALRAFYDRHDLAAARDAWQRQTDEPSDPVELSMIAMLDAFAGSDAALPYIERVRSYEPAEADAILAMLRFHQGRAAEAATSIESALKQMATDPWPLEEVKIKTLDLAQELGSQNPELARRMLVALATPFSTGDQPDVRLTTAVSLTRTAGFAETCRGPLSALEPHPPWTLGMLTLRRDCYGLTGDPRLDVAQRELTTFVEHDAQRFSLPAPATAP